MNMVLHFAVAIVMGVIGVCIRVYLALHYSSWWVLAYDPTGLGSIVPAYFYMVVILHMNIKHPR